MNPVTKRTAIKSRVKNLLVKPSALRQVDSSSVYNLLPISEGDWTPGGLFLAQVESIGHVNVVENVRDSHPLSSAYIPTELVEGMLILVMLGARKGVSTAHFVIPSIPTDMLELHSRGGQVGVMVPDSYNPVRYSGTHTKVRLIGAVASDSTAHNLRKFALKVGAKKGTTNPQIILVVGTAMDSGKTMAGAMVIHALVSSGYEVGSLKATGVANLADLVRAASNGASPVLSLMDFGYPTTIDLERKEVNALFHTMVDYCSAHKRLDYLVVELGDGVLYTQNEFLLKSKRVASSVSHVVLAASDSGGAFDAVNTLRDFGYLEKLRMIGGAVASVPVGAEEFRRRCDVPVEFICPSRVPNDEARVAALIGK